MQLGGLGRGEATLSFDYRFQRRHITKYFRWVRWLHSFPRRPDAIIEKLPPPPESRNLLTTGKQDLGEKLSGMVEHSLRLKPGARDR